MDRVFLDANILFPLTLRDLFVELHRSGAITTLWSEDVQREWRDKALQNHIDICRKAHTSPKWTLNSLQRQNDLLDHMLPTSKVTGYQELISAITDLHDMDDRHVVAAAAHGDANVVISHDDRAGLAPVLAKYRIKFFSADDYLLDLINRQGIIGPVIAAVRRQRSDYRKPPLSALELIERYAENRMPKFSAILRPFLTRF
jgi:predicted nucleic acid-binding protein